MQSEMSYMHHCELAEFLHDKSHILHDIYSIYDSIFVNSGKFGENGEILIRVS